MRAILLLTALAFSSRAMAADWLRAGGMMFWQGLTDAIDVHPAAPMEEVVEGRVFALTLEPDCGTPIIQRVRFIGEGGRVIQVDPVAGRPRQWKARADQPLPLRKVGVEITTWTARCHVNVWVWHEPVPPPPPPPDIAEDPTVAEAQAVADRVWDEHPTTIEQAVPFVTNGKNAVYLRFLTLRQYRDYIAKCAELHTDPDSRVLEVSATRHVRVELVHQVTGGT